MRPSARIAREHGAGRLPVAREVEVDGQHARARETRRLQLLAVELAVPQGQVDVVAERDQLLAPDPADADHLLVVALEELGRRDVVVDQRAPPAMLRRAGVSGDGSA